MNDKPKDGGSAFPSQQEKVDGLWNQTYESGMSLRDWFAGMAMQARIIALGDHQHTGTDIKAALREVDKRHSETAERAYRHADAMLAERNKTP